MIERMAERSRQSTKKFALCNENSKHRKQRCNFPQAKGTPFDDIPRLQRAIGNHAVQRLVESGVIQSKLKIGQPGDIYEQEADRLADALIRMPGSVCPSYREKGIVQKKMEEEERQKVAEEELNRPAPSSTQMNPLVQWNVTDENRKKSEEGLLKTKHVSSESIEAADIESVINSLSGKGAQLSESARSYFEPRFGYDFSEVRIHTDNEANKSAQLVNAKAFTLGNDIVFGASQYSLGTAEGRRLMAHELTHVVQQTSGLRRRSTVGPVGLLLSFQRQVVAQHQVSSSRLQMTPEKKRWGGRPGSKWAPVPWTYDELNRLKAAERHYAKTKEDKRLLEQKYFRGEQVIKNWDNRYGKWDSRGLADPYAHWFQSEMKPSPTSNRFSFNPKVLWTRFLRKRASSMGLLEREVAINPFWPEKDKVRYLLYKDELEIRDPTSLEFYKPYAKYVNPAKPRALVEPPKEAQKFLKESPYAEPIVSNKKIRAEIARLRKILKLD